MAIIESGKSGDTMEVDSKNRAHVLAVVIDEALEANGSGDAFNINTGAITLTNATDSAVLYVQNNETRDLHIRAIAIGMKTSTGGAAADMAEVTIVRNPTGGDIITDASAVAINSNRNYGSPKTLSVDAFKGDVDKTLSGGEDHLFIFQNDGSRLFASIDEILTKGTAIGIKIKPPASNTSMVVYAALICHLNEML